MIVNQVYPDSPAAKAGIRLHDIIVAVDGNAITEPTELAKAVQAKGAKPLVLKLAAERWKVARCRQWHPSERSPARLRKLRTSRRDTSVTYDVVRPASSWITAALSPMSDRCLRVAFLQCRSARAVIRCAKFAGAGAGLYKRLDALDSDIKDLRKLVEDLQKTAAKIERTATAEVVAFCVRRCTRAGETPGRSARSLRLAASSDRVKKRARDGRRWPARLFRAGF